MTFFIINVPLFLHLRSNEPIIFIAWKELPQIVWLIVYMRILQLLHTTRTYALVAGGTNIDSDKRAMNKDNLDIIVGTPGIAP